MMKSLEIGLLKIGIHHVSISIIYEYKIHDAAGGIYVYKSRVYIKTCT